MTSYIVSSTDKKKREAYIADFCEELNIDKYDIIHSNFENSKNTTSIGINDIKSIHQKIFLKPMNSENKVIIIDDAHLLTIEAQNALLKVLEEPPVHTIIILSSDKKDAFLPTILSRCHTVELESQAIILAEEEIPQFIDFINRFQSMPLGEKLKIAETNGIDKEKAVDWISKMILVLREEIFKNESDKNMLTSIRKFHELYTLLKTSNVNPRFAIENTLISM